MISASKGHRIVKSLIQKGLCRKIDLRLGKKGVTKFLILSEKGYRAIGMSPRKGLTRGGGPIHDIWVHLLTMHLRKLREDWKVDAERKVSDKYVDIIIQLEDGDIIAIEVELTSVHAEANIRKDLEVGCSLAIVGCKDKKVLEEVRQIASEFNNCSKISICLLSQLLQCDKLSKVFDCPYLQERGL